MMNRKLVAAILIFLFAIFLVYFIRISQNNSLVVQSDLNQSLENLRSFSNQTIVYEVLSNHSSKEDCWVVFESRVYDITSFLPKHKGGIDKIEPYCGTLGFEEAFIKQHGRSKVSLFMKVGVLMGDFDIKGQVN